MPSSTACASSPPANSGRFWLPPALSRASMSSTRNSVRQLSDARYARCMIVFIVSVVEPA